MTGHAFAISNHNNQSSSQIALENAQLEKQEIIEQCKAIIGQESFEGFNVDIDEFICELADIADIADVESMRIAINLLDFYKLTDLDSTLDFWRGFFEDRCGTIFNNIKQNGDTEAFKVFKEFLQKLYQTIINHSENNEDAKYHWQLICLDYDYIEFRRSFGESGIELELPFDKIIRSLNELICFPLSFDAQNVSPLNLIKEFDLTIKRAMTFCNYYIEAYDKSEFYASLSQDEKLDLEKFRQILDQHVKSSRYINKSIIARLANIIAGGQEPGANKDEIFIELEKIFLGEKPQFRLDETEKMDVSRRIKYLLQFQGFLVHAKRAFEQAFKQWMAAVTPSKDSYKDMQKSMDQAWKEVNSNNNAVNDNNSLVNEFNKMNLQDKKNQASSHEIMESMVVEPEENTNFTTPSAHDPLSGLTANSDDGFKKRTVTIEDEDTEKPKRIKDNEHTNQNNRQTNALATGSFSLRPKL